MQKRSSIVPRSRTPALLASMGYRPGRESHPPWIGRITASSKGALARLLHDDGKLMNPGARGHRDDQTADVARCSAQSAQTRQTHDPRISSSAISDSGKTCPPSTTNV